jgi:hypothetical protein
MLGTCRFIARYQHNQMTLEGNQMATEFDPVTGKPVRPAPMLPDEPLVEDRRSGMGSIGLLAGLAIAIVLGLTFWNMADRSNTTALNTAPGVTTGSSTTTPAPTPAPSPSMDANKTDSK